MEEGVPEGYYEIDLAQPSVKRNGQGPDDHHALARRSTRPSPRPTNCSAIRHLGGGDRSAAANPLDYDPLVESVRKTGKVLLVSTRWSAAA